MEKTGAGGSFTTELAAFFPVVIILILALMQMGMWFARRALVTAVSEEALCLYGRGREKLLSQEEACALADEYLRSALSSLDTDDVSWYWDWGSGILKETMTLKVEGRYGLSVLLLGVIKRVPHIGCWGLFWTSTFAVRIRNGQ